uniref:Uncharacterized protein n=1 Tax=Arundo donax TaxID=35708 RepID=A0A0A8Z8V6_ARUDO
MLFWDIYGICISHYSLSRRVGNICCFFFLEQARTIILQVTTVEV